MFRFGLILSLVPIVAWFLAKRRTAQRTRPLVTLFTILALTGIGLFAALPFLTSHGVGTGEAANYRLALADAIEQLRAGHLPLVGQTEYAFNGRVHPLRNAPYLFGLGGVLDALTLHGLTYWELQNLSLAFSLLATAFTCYASLRWATACARPVAIGLSALYTLSPALLAAGTINLFMTIHAAVFVPIAIGAVVRQTRESIFRNDVILGAALAATWLAHPPVALWTTLAAGLVRLYILWENPSARARWGLFAASVIGLAAAACVFVSVATLSSDLGYFPEGAEVRADILRGILQNLRASFPASILPVSARATALSDLQFGYIAWILLAGGVIATACRHRTPGDRNSRVGHLADVGLLIAITVSLALVLPVPGLTEFLWSSVPLPLQSMTSVWPMQRLYLVATALLVFLSARWLPSSWPTATRRRQAAIAGALFGCVWLVWEAAQFARGGLALRWTADDTARSASPSNIDLTVTSYAFLPLPPTFVNGVMDPNFEFTILNSDAKEIDSPLTSALRTAPVVGHGAIILQKSSVVTATEGDAIVLQPGKRYLVDFDFVAGPFEGTLEIFGTTLNRHYALPSAGQVEGFGIGGKHRHAVSIWTSQKTPEPVAVRFAGTAWPRPADARGTIATFTVREVDLKSLPVFVTSWMPLRCEVVAPQNGCNLVTPRGLLKGYIVLVNGHHVRPVASPSGELMVALPAGHSTVEVRYDGPLLLRIALYISTATWLGLLASPFVARPRARVVLQRTWVATRGVRRGLWRYRLATILVLVGGGVALSLWWAGQTYVHAVGPIRVKFIMPPRQIGRSQPIVVTGKPGAGTSVFINYIDPGHVSVGADIWGTAYSSEPIGVDYTQEQELVVNSSALYPLDHPRVRALSSVQRERLRQDFRVELNGRLVLHEHRLAYESTVQQVTIGRTLIGGSLTQPTFTGEIVGVDRLPLPENVVAAGGDRLQVKLLCPKNATGRTEDLISFGLHGAQVACTIEYLDEGLVRLTQRNASGSVVAEGVARRKPRAPDLIEFSFGAGSHPEDVLLSIYFDEQKLFGPPELVPLARPLPIAVGISDTALPGVDCRFSGPQLSAAIVNPLEAKSGADATGPLRLVVTFPKDKPGRPEPLLTTGRNGAGDFAYVTYIDTTHVRFALDHWGVGGATGPAVAIDYSVPHEIEIRTSALYPEINDKAWGAVPPERRRQLRQQMEVLLDGKIVVSGAFAAHPSTAAEITPAENRIGGSNCDVAFTGEIHAENRLGLAVSSTR